MNLSIIAAIGKNNELGKDNDLIWHLKDDMKFFKETTWGHTVVMGRKTFDSLPGLLKGRNHIVISRKTLELPKEVKLYKSPQEFLEDYENSDEEIFNIGGASMYKELLDYANKLYLTEIDAEAKADVYFPYFDKNDYDREILGVHENQEINFKHVLYKRRQI